MKNFKSKICSERQDHVSIVRNGLCRFCQGRTDYEQISALDTVLRAFGFYPKPKPVKSKPKVQKEIPIKRTTYKLIDPEDVKVGMVIGQHGKVISMEPITGRSLYRKGKKFRHAHKTPAGYKLVEQGQDGILFKTDQREAFYGLNDSVAVVK